MQDLIDRVPDWLRRILVFPVAAAAATLCRVIVIYTYYYWTKTPMSDAPLIYRAIEGAAAVLGFMAAIYYLVPVRKFLAALITTILWSLVLVYQAGTRWSIIYPELPWINIVYGASAIVVLIYFTLVIYQEEKRRKSKETREEYLC